MATFRYILKSGDMGQRALGPMVVISLLFAVACGPVATQVDDAKPSSDSTPARASEAESGLDFDELKAVEDATVVAEEACPKFLEAASELYGFEIERVDDEAGCLALPQEIQDMTTNLVIIPVLDRGAKGCFDLDLAVSAYPNLSTSQFEVDGVQITLTDLDSTQIEIFQAASATWCDDDLSYMVQTNVAVPGMTTSDLLAELVATIV